ncbi:unnamed protein product [Thlaspi arvense]|uniref:Uncharacterized protein n=1 Tax=Thlaspi arvense TaxID=13288 RepID=A0AAU9RD78_THLAR|nr:unnamed protein product [Thlaspi arvense]
MIRIGQREQKKRMIPEKTGDRSSESQLHTLALLLSLGKLHVVVYGESNMVRSRRDEEGRMDGGGRPETRRLHRRIRHRWAAIAQQMPGRSDNDIKNHWNSCLKKRLERNGIDPMTHQPSNKECCSSFSSTASPSSSSGSARLLNRIATGISSTKHGVDRIKNILSDPRITSMNGQEEEFVELKKDHGKILASDDQEDDFLLWDEEKLRHFMEEIGVVEFETTSYDGVYNSS